jgi:hypothetical protein
VTSITPDREAPCMSAVTQMRFALPSHTHRLLKAKAAKRGQTLRALLKELAESAVADEPATDQQQERPDVPVTDTRPDPGCA